MYSDTYIKFSVSQRQAVYFNSAQKTRIILILIDYMIIGICADSCTGLIPPVFSEHFRFYDRDGVENLGPEWYILPAEIWHRVILLTLRPTFYRKY